MTPQLDGDAVAEPNYDDEFDAIVVGAGLAGSAAALTMANRGLEVLMIERGSSPGAKNVFGGVCYTPTIRELTDFDGAPLERYVAERRFGMLSKSDETAVSISPGEWHEEPHNDSYTVLRGEFDEWFAEQAVEEGTTLVTSTTVTGLVRENGRIVGVETDRPDGTIRAPYVVLAEGGNSLVSESADLKATENRENVAVGVKEVLEFPQRDAVIEDRFRLTDDAGVSYHYFGEGAVGDAFGGGFIYTNDDTISVGVAYRIEDAVAADQSPEETLNAFKSHPAVAPLVRDARTVEYSAKTIPEGGAESIPDLVHDGAAIVGDAAGLVLNNGVHLEGTNMAVESGYHAGNAIARAADQGRVGADALQAYPDALERSFVVQNLERYAWMMDAVEADRDLLFEDLPRAFADAGTEYFRMDRTPKEAHAENAKRAVLDAVGGWTGAAKLALRYRKVVT
ncbi:FAD-dependent oxidoreductase [Natrarchaeobaculum sulfurireducens]|uniref:Dehydrogenase (Flavoprotein) n=1 Tax=Natrarchaeobaculum sulfurireducens TaxID=2044521 RepID=A0A346PRA1_9EURY|nr:FAD-dependent oxidoreductase [Natrarchaeobaculum sulfurireducens]AXR77962.1 Dehydrogenase (flavoprotein) [Natrarchaeobaculum sulfurireducens]AXR82046.1 Electron transfer flavoprotein-quinone oxidoreductase FixC [Natrarchaeobaculum sulfurireducens]